MPKSAKPAKTTKRGKPSDFSAALPGPETITRHELSNGVVVLVRENFTSPSVVVDGDLRVGALWETRAQAGLADFTTTALMRGTERRTFAEIYEQVESVGASLWLSGGTHTTGLSGKALAEDLPLLLDIAAEALRHPVFPEAQVEQLRGEILTHLAIRDDDTRARTTEAFYELAYPGHPYSIDSEGYPDTIRALTRADLVAFHRRNFGPRGMILTIVGAVKTEEALALAERYFGDWANPEQTPAPDLPPVAAPASSLRRQVVMPGKTQADLMLGVPGPARVHPKFLTARMANNILGSFGMGGRIGEQVREKHGMAYYAASALEGGMGPGPWYAYAGVNPANVDKAIEIIVREIQKFTARKVTEQELADNKALFIGRLPLGLETNSGVASSISNMELHNLGLDYLQRYPALINAITRDEVLAAAREFLSPEKYVLAIAGPEPKEGQPG
jgi:zinc protease